ncbi:MAG: hypothetical protein E6J90_36955 [Deltaproteobacteria bacterium]|nr:MAG: hypothetical protein E6J90_36955 [Deltaproteobacteria bacterium]
MRRSASGTAASASARIRASTQALAVRPGDPPWHRAPPPPLGVAELAIARAASGVRHRGIGERADPRAQSGAQSVTEVEDRGRRIDHGLGDRVRIARMACWSASKTPLHLQLAPLSRGVLAHALCEQLDHPRVFGQVADLAAQLGRATFVRRPRLLQQPWASARHLSAQALAAVAAVPPAAGLSRLVALGRRRGDTRGIEQQHVSCSGDIACGLPQPRLSARDRPLDSSV